MRVKYLVSDEICCLQNGTWYLAGSITNLPDDIALEAIKQEFVEPFSYSIPDQEIVKLFNKFSEAIRFEMKVDIFIEAYSKIRAEPNLIIDVLLEGGTQLVFKLIPESPGEWYYYNKNLSDLFIKESFICNIKDFINSLDQSLKNYSYYENRKDAELEFIKKYTLADDPKGILYWYNQVRYGNVPIDPSEMKGFLSKELEYGLDIFLHAKAVAEYEGYLRSKGQENKKQSSTKNEEITTLSEMFNEVSEFKNIMTLLACQEYCDQNTHYWKDEKKGSLSMLAALIKHLFPKGYLKRRPSNKEVKLIAKNTFGITLSTDTVKKSKGTDKDFPFIPPARTD